MIHGLDRQRLIGALIALATVLFLVAIAPGMRYRREARRAAIAIYAATAAAVLVWAVLWLLGLRF
jgi:hypothetical protein